MAKLKHSQMRALDEIFNMQSGYVLDFSNSTMAEFFSDEFQVDIYDERYAYRGTSKANRVRAFIETEPDHRVKAMLQGLWQHRETLEEYQAEHKLTNQANLPRFSDILSCLQPGPNVPAVDALKRSAGVYDFDTVQRDLDRAAASVESDPEDAVTAACSTLESVCRSILIELDIPFPERLDLKSLFKQLRDPLGLSAGQADISDEIAEDVRRILNGLGNVVEGVGALRTHAGDAHGREKGYRRIDARIARLAVHGAATASLFLIETWQRKFPAKLLPRHEPARAGERSNDIQEGVPSRA